jgi:hypothetical protein
MTSRSLTFGRGPEADVTEEIARSFGIPPAQFGEPEPPQYRPCVFCGSAWSLHPTHPWGCPYFTPTEAAIDMWHDLHVVKPPLPWEAQ